MQLRLAMETPRVGAFHVFHSGYSKVYPITLHELPTLVETFKSHNHINLIKSADIGQAFMLHPLVPDFPGQDPNETLRNNLEILKGMDASGALPREISCGVTPPMASGCVSA
jgi:TATA-binding protein-associated factor Taf7